jgi:hypothetical protein
MPNMQKMYKKMCEPVFNMQNTEGSNFCLFVMYMHSPLCWWRRRSRGRWGWAIWTQAGMKASDGGQAAEMKTWTWMDEGWSQCQEPRVTCNLIARRTAIRDVYGLRPWSSRKVTWWSRYLNSPSDGELRRAALHCCRNAKGLWRTLEPMSGTACVVRPRASNLRSVFQDVAVEGRRRMAGRVANNMMRMDKCKKPMSGTACVVRP